MDVILLIYVLDYQKVQEFSVIKLSNVNETTVNSKNNI